MDANRAYPQEGIAAYVRAIADAGVTVAEDPCSLAPDSAFEKLQRDCPIPLLVDFACTSRQDAALFLDRGARSLMVKPGRIGLSEALEIDALCAKSGARVSLGMFYETALGTALLTFMLVSGKTPAVFSVKSGAQVLALYAVLVLCQLYRQRFFLEPERERGLHWHAGLLRIAKWPYMLLALRDAFAGPNRGYTLTRKVAPPRRRYAAAPVQLILAGVVAAALAAGAARGVLHNRSVVIGAAVLVTSALLVALVDLQRAPPPYDDALATRELDARLHASLELLGTSSNDSATTAITTQGRGQLARDDASGRQPTGATRWGGLGLQNGWRDGGAARLEAGVDGDSRYESSATSTTPPAAQL